MILSVIKDISIIVALVTVSIYHYENLRRTESFTQVIKAVINRTQGRLEELEARMKHFETAKGENMIKDFLANGGEKEGNIDTKYTQMLGIIGERKRRSIMALNPICGNIIQSI